MCAMWGVMIMFLLFALMPFAALYAVLKWMNGGRAPWVGWDNRRGPGQSEDDRS